MPHKKLAAIIALVLLLGMLLNGCGGSGGESPTTDSHGGEATEPADGHGDSASHGGESPAPAHSESAGHSGETTAPAHSQATAAPSHTPAPSPTPTPAPTETPVGTLVDGWVAGIPDYVPKFGYGEIDISQSKITEGSISTVFYLCFRGVRREDLESYAAKLQEKGYKMAMAKIGETYTLTASKDFGWNSVSMVVTLTEANGVAVYALDAPV